MTVNGTFQINTGAWTGTGSLDLCFRRGAHLQQLPAAVRGVENTDVYWPNGVPHVILANTGGVQLNATRTIGKLTADANTSLEIGNGDFTLVVSGELLAQRGQDPYACWSLELAEPLRLWRGAYPARSHSQQRADRFQIMGNWLNEGGTYNSNGRGLLFGGSSTQTISSTSGTETFECPAIDKTGGSLILASAPATNVTFSSCGTSVWSFSQGTLDLNGRVLTLTGSGTDVLLGIGTLAVTGGAGSRVAMNTNKVFYSYNSPALYFDTNVAVEISAGMNFGISGLVTIRGTLLIKPGGYVVAGRAPSYRPASTLKYDTPGSTYVASEEWYPNTTSGPGVPQNVEITAGTTLSFGAASTPRTALGNVTVDGALVYRPASAATSTWAATG